MAAFGCVTTTAAAATAVAAAAAATAVAAAAVAAECLLALCGCLPAPPLQDKFYCCFADGSENQLRPSHASRYEGLGFRV